jgi:hypothetical protein
MTRFKYKHHIILQIMRFVCNISFTCAILSTGAIAADEIAFSVNPAILEKNISNCNASVKQTMQENIDELKQKPFKDYVVRLNGAFMTKYVKFSNNRVCSIGLLDNAILILESYLQSSSEPLSVKNELASAKLQRASFVPQDLRGSYYEDADKLIRQFIDDSPIDLNETIATPWYFAAHSYIEAAKLTDDDEKTILLDKAIAIAENGRNALIGKAMKKQLTEPLGIALGDKAKYYKLKDRDQFRKTIEKSTQYLMEGFASGDNLAAYNLAVNYSLLSDAENSKKWLLVIEERKAADKQICFQGLLRDPDLSWLRETQKEWLGSYFIRNCT